MADGVRQVVDGRLPGSCQSLLIKSVIEMSTKPAQKEKNKQKKKREAKPLDQIKYLPVPGQDGPRGLCVQEGELT